jgi:uncharacterized protein YkwD
MSSGSILDLLAVVVVTLAVLDGGRRGFFVSTLSVVILGIAFLGGLRLLALGDSPGLAAFGLSSPIVSLLLFLACLVLSHVIQTIVDTAIVPARRVVFAEQDTTDYVERLAGVIPGVARGAIYVLFLGTLLAAASSRLAMPLSSTASVAFGVATQAMADSAIEKLVSSVSGSPVAVVSTMSSDRATADFPVAVDIQPETAAVEDAESEKQFLAIVNLAREQAGAGALIPDDGLHRAAWGHTAEMLLLGYFAHDSPEMGAPPARYAAAGVTYRQLGENLAYAPSLESAFNGLYASEQHRETMLSTTFHRTGLGIARGPTWILVTQEFTD